MSWRHIIGPIFIDANITTATYMEIFNTFVNQLDNEEPSVGYFQQDGATSHTSHTSMAEIQSFFADRVISKELWPPCSPDLMLPDYFLWRYLKGRVYQKKPWTIDTDKARFNPVWTQMVATSSTCYDVITFLTQWGKSASNFVAISSLVVKLLKKCHVR